MDNQNPAQQQVPPAPPPSPAEPSGSSNLMKKLIIGAAVILVITAVGTGGYLLGAKKNVPETITQITPTAIPTPTPDPTANWKTYTGNGFSVKYPSSWIVKVDPIAKIVSIYDPTTIVTEEGNGGSTINIPTEYLNIQQIKRTTQSAKDYANQATSGPEYTGVQANIKTITVGTLPAEIYIEEGEGSNGYDIAISNGNTLSVLNIPVADPATDSTINQILSTFQFTN